MASDLTCDTVHSGRGSDFGVYLWSARLMARWSGPLLWALLSLDLMSRMVSKNPIKRKREEKRLAKLQKQGRLVEGIEIPQNALAANPDAQNHHGGYSGKFYYQDIHYTCAGCGKPGVWTAQQQKRYFEVQKGNIYNVPKWCYKCHSRRMKNSE